MGGGVGYGYKTGIVEVDGDKVPPQWSQAGGVAGVGDSICYFLPVPAAGIFCGGAEGRVKVHSLPNVGLFVTLVKLIAFWRGSAGGKQTC